MVLNSKGCFIACQVTEYNLVVWILICTMTYKIEGLQSNHNLKLVDPLNPLHFGS